MIDWDGTRKRWNLDHGTDFQNRKEFLAILYAEHPSVFRISPLIHVSPSAIHSAMITDDIDRLPKGHRNPSAGARKILRIKDTSRLTLNEIAKKTGLHRQACWVLLDKLELPWIKLRKRRA